MRMRQIVAILSLLLCVVVVLAGGKSSTVSRLTADFKQTRTTKMLSSSAVSTGRMFYRAPATLRWEYTSPYALAFDMNGDKVTFTRNGRRTELDRQESKMFREMGRVMMNSVVVSSRKRSMDLQLPNGLRALYKSVTLYFNASTHLAERIVMVEKNGDKMEIELRNVIIYPFID